MDSIYKVVSGVKNEFGDNTIDSLAGKILSRYRLSYKVLHLFTFEFVNISE